MSAADISRPYSSSESLKALCLTNTLFATLVQPVLFRRVQLHGGVRLAHFICRKLERMFNSRESSVEWVHQLFLCWELPTGAETPEPSEDEVKGQLEVLAGNLLKRMRNLRTLHVDNLKIPYRLYAQICQLPRLTKVVSRGATVGAPATTDTAAISTDTLVLTHLTLSCGFTVHSGITEPADPSIAKLARSSYLTTLDVWRLSPENLVNILGPSTLGGGFPKLTELSIVHPGSPFATLISISSHCPGLHKLTLGSASRRNPPVQVPPELSSKIWSNLKEFQGWLEAGQLFIPRRPVQKIKISGASTATKEAWDTKTALTPLSTGSAVVKELVLRELPWRDECVEHLAALFPLLEVLEVSCDGPDHVSRPC